MKTFVLKLKGTEDIINKYDSVSITEAIEYCSKVKQLTKYILLEIFEVIFACWLI